MQRRVPNLAREFQDSYGHARRLPMPLFVPQENKGLNSGLEFATVSRTGAMSVDI